MKSNIPEKVRKWLRRKWKGIRRKKTEDEENKRGEEKEIVKSNKIGEGEGKE